MALFHLATMIRFRPSWCLEFASFPWGQRSGLKKTTSPGTLDLQMQKSRANQKGVAGDPNNPILRPRWRGEPTQQGRHSTVLVLRDRQAHVEQPSNG